MFSTAYLPHLLSSLALTSLGIHVLRQRKDAEAERAQLAAQLSILEDTAARLRAGGRVSGREVERLLKLARSQRTGRGEESVQAEEQRETEKEEIGWRDVLLGRRATREEAVRGEHWDRRDLERVRREVAGDGEARS